MLTRPFAYNTGSTIDGTIQLGNLAIGISEQEYSLNPGGVKWWMGPNECLGYIIAHETADGSQPNPVATSAYVGFWRSDILDEETFISLAQYVSNFTQTFTTGKDAKTWLNNNGYWTTFNSIVTSGLTLNLDAGDTSSYPGTGNTWTDTISSIVFTLYNNPSYNSNNGGYLSFSPASSQYAQSSTSLSSLSTWTIEAWHFYDGTNIGGSPTIVTELWPNVNYKLNFNLGNGSDSSPNLQAGFFDGSWHNTPDGYVLTPGNWYHIIGSYDGATIRLYVNNNLISSTNYSGTPTSGGDGIVLMRRWDGLSQYWGGRLGVIRIYDRCLSSLEITQNYYAEFCRFYYVETTPTPTPSITPSIGIVVTATPSITPSITPSETPSITPSITPTITPSETPSITPSITPTITPTITPNETPSITPSITPTITPSETPSITPSITPTITPSETPSITPSVTTSVTPSVSVTLSTTPIINVTPSITPSVTPSISISSSVTPSITPSRTPSISISPSITPSVTPSITPSISITPSLTPTSTLVKGGAINFGGTSNLNLSASSDWAVGTGDFTVEWFQYQQNNGNENFIFDLGTADNFAASIKSGGNALNLYQNGTRTFSPTITNSTNTWYHVAISRVSSTIHIYFNGTRVATGANSTNITDNTSTFYIGCEDPANPTGDNWPGYLTNFRFIKGVGLYSGTTLTVPTLPLSATAETKLLLKALNSGSFLTDSSGTNKTVNNNGTSFIASTPF